MESAYLNTTLLINSRLIYSVRYPVYERIIVFHIQRGTESHWLFREMYSSIK